MLITSHARHPRFRQRLKSGVSPRCRPQHLFVALMEHPSSRTSISPAWKLPASAPHWSAPPPAGTLEGHAAGLVGEATHFFRMLAGGTNLMSERLGAVLGIPVKLRHGAPGAIDEQNAELPVGERVTLRERSQVMKGNFLAASRIPRRFSFEAGAKAAHRGDRRRRLRCASSIRRTKSQCSGFNVYPRRGDMAIRVRPVARWPTRSPAERR